DPRLAQEDLEAVAAGCANLEKHIENARAYGVPCVVAINRFDSDRASEIQVVQERALAAGARAAVECAAWAHGGEGGTALAEAVLAAAEEPVEFRFLYDLDLPIADKIRVVATRMYGAADVEFTPRAKRMLARYTALGWDAFPVCMAKTHLSLSHDPELKGRPEGFVLPVRDIRPSVGAGFLYALCGEIRTMPGLPSHPAGERVDLDEDGNVVGLA
ncbi:formate--tetrahydrofolate ligase, partial [Candidatus Bipolaricaulota bacterium]|nr:formate--tetrahydrofolate ligase [Candidatus Bipolaricaulota bacterium]